MAHIHSVYDTDVHFKLDLKTRTFLNVNSLKLLIAQGDHNSERFTFEIPRYVDGHDMMECDYVEVHFNNTNATTQETSQDVYIVDDVQVSEDDDEIIIFSWLLSNVATKYNGSLSFSIKFKCVTNGSVDYQWNTLIFSDIHVGASY